MSRKYPKKVRNENAAKLKAAEAFIKAWTNSGIASSLAADYNCTLTCEEADGFAGVLRAYRFPDHAQGVMDDHLDDCDFPHYHQGPGVWTFDIEAGGPAVEGVEDPVWTVVAEGKDGFEAEERAKQWLRNALKHKYPGYFYLTAGMTEAGAPSSMALYHWIDLRKAA